ncbi:hypothetical protein GF312_06020, partial [Candidatus Poribacteria bacterium]|nr:hypothetical protein [Candidatus Poribacteria bacterium]
DKGLEKSQVTKLIKQSDKQHQEYVKHFFLMDIDDPDLYDLVINTTKISPDTAARLIVQAARQFTITSRTSTNG